MEIFQSLCELKMGLQPEIEKSSVNVSVSSKFHYVTVAHDSLAQTHSLRKQDRAKASVTQARFVVCP